MIDMQGTEAMLHVFNEERTGDDLKTESRSVDYSLYMNPKSNSLCLSKGSKCSNLGPRYPDGL